MEIRKVQSALISVYNKDGIEGIVQALSAMNATIYSTGGTQKFIEQLGAKVVPVEQLTEYPSILNGRVKTLHPHVFGGILARRDFDDDLTTLERYGIPTIDLVIVDLYPFELTVNSTTDETEVIEKIDIGGVSLIRAAAKNYKDVLVGCRAEDYSTIENYLSSDGGSSLDQRKKLAATAFAVTSQYDSAIANYFGAGDTRNKQVLRYGENPHQKAFFEGNLADVFLKLHGKDLSYNNLLDCDAAVALIQEFDEPTFAIIKHTNACGVASDVDLASAWTKALAGDPQSAFGGIAVTNEPVTSKVAELIDKIFLEILIAPSFDEQALKLLTHKKNRILLQYKSFDKPGLRRRTVLNGSLVQEYDELKSSPHSLTTVTKAKPTEAQTADLLFAEKICKHLKSNAIVIARQKQLLGMGCGQTSRVDALNNAISKAQSFGFDLANSVMASDAFFPFNDCVLISAEHGISAIIQPGGSMRDQESIDACNENKIAMVFSGQRHFKH